MAIEIDAAHPGGRIEERSPAQQESGLETAAPVDMAEWEEGVMGAGRLTVIERLLRERETLWQQIGQEHRLGQLVGELLAAAAFLLAAYGATMGANANAIQALTSAIKLPLLTLLTLLICLPTLYLFNLFYGGRLSVWQILTLVLAAITVMAALSVAFAPITIFFLITARDYAFFKLLNVAILALTGVAGLSFLVAGMRRVAALGRQRLSLPLLWLWLGIFGFVGTQLGWTLRPFFGAPELDFQLFRPLESNFYTHLAQTIIGLIRRG